MSHIAEPQVAPGVAQPWPRFFPSFGRPWGIFAALLIAAFAGYGARETLLPAILAYTPLPALARHSIAWGAFGIILDWGTEFAVILLAVWMIRMPLRDYLGWTQPRAGDVVLGLAVAVALGLLPNLLQFAVLGKPLNPSQIADYQQAIAGGTSKLWFVFAWWPAILLAPLVEESVFRGFLWRSFSASRLGNIGALLLTALLFSAIHYNQTIMADGSFNGWPFIEHFIDGLGLGALRWRSGTTTVPFLMHVWMNLWTSMAVIVLLPLT
jgi:membrane protease YdiL (CAAX protease family)